MEKYLSASDEQGKTFYKTYGNKGRVVMLNLLRFKSQADYTNLPGIRPATSISGKEAYGLYMENTLPELKKAGARIIFFGNGKDFLIGPQEEYWDAILLVEHQSVKEFMLFAQNENYLKGAGHRAAALDDSRLLPVTEGLVQDFFE